MNGHPHQIQSEYPQGAPGNVCTCVQSAVLSPCLTSACTSTWYLLREKQHVEVNFDHLYYMWDLKPSCKRILML